MFTINNIIKVMNPEPSEDVFYCISASTICNAHQTEADFMNADAHSFFFQLCVLKCGVFREKR